MPPITIQLGPARLIPPTNSAPVWGTPAPSFQAGVGGSYTFPVSDPDGDPMSAIVGPTSATFPSWLSVAGLPPRLIATTGAIAGTYSGLKAQVDDGQGHVVESPAFSLIITAAANVAPVWGTPSPSFVAGAGGTYNLPVTDADGDPMSAVVGPTSASYPSWLSVAGTPPRLIATAAAVAGNYPGLKAQVDDGHGHTIESPAFTATVVAATVVNDLGGMIITNPTQGPNHGGGFWWASVRVSNGDLNQGPDGTLTGLSPAVGMSIATKNPDADHMTWAVGAARPTGPWADAVGRDENIKPTPDPVADRTWYFGGGSSGSPGWYENVAKVAAYWDWAANTMVPIGPVAFNPSNTRVLSAPYAGPQGYWNGAIYYFGGFGSTTVSDARNVGKVIIRPTYTARYDELTITGPAPVINDPSTQMTYNMYRGGFDSRTGQGWIFDINGELWVLNHDGFTGKWTQITTFGNRPPNAVGAGFPNTTFYGTWCLLETANCIVGYIGVNSVNLSSSTVNKWFVLDLGTLVWRQSTVSGPPSTFAGASVMQYDRFNERAVYFYNDSGTGGIGVWAFKPGVTVP